MKTIDDLNISIPEEVSKYTAHSSEIAIMLKNYLRSHGNMSKKRFAELVGKTPSDITRWLSGNHNFTILTLSLIEAKTGLNIIRNLETQEIQSYLNEETFIPQSITALQKEVRKLKARIKHLESNTTSIQYDFQPLEVMLKDYDDDTTSKIVTTRLKHEKLA